MSNNLYTYGDRDYFTLPIELPSDDFYKKAIEQSIPDTWILNRKNIWLAGSPADGSLPLQGFKIHISAIESQAIEVIEKTLSHCVAHNTAFKVICRNDIATNMTSKSCGRSSAGKLITIYPRNDKVFKSLINDLYLSLKDNLGPYILSDKRYLDSQVVHYRYGGFLLLPKIKADGTTLACIKDDAGNIVEDERNAFYQLPHWVKEPFPEALDASTEAVPLNNRYKVIKALAFSNSGGVYQALDLRTNQEVVIKEARPHINFRSMAKTSVYADQVLKNEYKALQLLQSSAYFPKAIDWFVEWEHSFLVEEFVQGIPLRKFRASSECTLVPYTDAPESAERFKGAFCWIAKSCIEAVMAAHERGIVLADISPNNIMVDSENKRIRFIDFDGAYRLKEGEVEGGKGIVPILSTPGFSDLQALLKNGSSYQADWYALGMVLYSILLPIQNLFDIDKDLRWELLPKLIDDCKLDPAIASVITALAQGEPDNALLSVKALEANFRAELAAKEALPFESLPNTAPRVSTAELKDEVDELIRLVKTGVPRENDPQFVPIDYRAFDLHPHGLAYGYYGPAVLLTQGGHQVPQHLLQKIDAKSVTEFSAGLLVGTAGMALAELELNRLDLAEQYAEESFNSPLFAELNSFGYGLAGIGFMALAMYRKTHAELYLSKAKEIGDLLAQRAITEATGVRYPAEKADRDPVGIAYGSAGIALFLLHLYQSTDDAQVLQLAKASLQYDINAGLRDDGSYSWGETADSTQILPYWEYGAGGVGAVIARFYEVTAQAHYVDILKSLAVTNFSRYSAEQGSFNGLSGFGELLLDIYRVTGEAIYLQSARQIADSVMLFSIKKPQGRIYPGRFSYRLSTDLAFGSSGIGLFLNRIITGQPRWLHDLA
ncbi:class III lanthionine synthetase LanKC [Shewanella sp.]|uniref:class III lanthionine synthetase LanKC n=1 Tax=Shewanella sp. TaxID=50422 RepID=UPI0040543C27